MLYVLWDTGVKIGQATHDSRVTRVSKGRPDHKDIDAGMPPHLWRRRCRSTGNRPLARIVQQVRLGIRREQLVERTERRWSRQGGSDNAGNRTVQGRERRITETCKSLYGLPSNISRARHPEETCPPPGILLHPGEFSRFFEAELILLDVRCHLHLLTNRKRQVTYDARVNRQDSGLPGWRTDCGRRTVPCNPISGCDKCRGTDPYLPDQARKRNM